MEAGEGGRRSRRDARQTATIKATSFPLAVEYFSWSRGAEREYGLIELVLALFLHCRITVACLARIKCNKMQIAHKTRINSAAMSDPSNPGISVNE